MNSIKLFCLIIFTSNLYNMAKAKNIDEWNEQNYCQTAKYMIKNSSIISANKQKQMNTENCSVTALSAPLLGKFSIYKAYAVSWSNGVAARVFVNNNNALKIMGVSENGIPFSWNNEHKAITKIESKYTQECSDLFRNKSEAQEITITQVKKYDDHSGAKVEIKYIDSQGRSTKGSCIFDRSKMLMATSKNKNDQYSKKVYVNY